MSTTIDSDFKCVVDIDDMHSNTPNDQTSSQSRFIIVAVRDGKATKAGLCSLATCGC